MIVNAMSLSIAWTTVALRIALSMLFSLIIGFNRDERGHPAGMRTTMLVCLAATLAQLQANILLTTVGKTTSSFSVLDPERLPLGILSGIGFIGAGVIMKRDNNTISGVTTAATIWFVTVLGLLFGGGQLGLGIAAGLIALCILWGLRKVEAVLPQRHTALLQLTFLTPPDEEDLRSKLKAGGCAIRQWSPTYRPPNEMVELKCTLSWHEKADREPHTPASIRALSDYANIASLTWNE
jgi:putative Mg2+ transporter-C (MgtC) family protein